MSDENEITPLLPFTSHRSRRSSKCSEIDENEIVSYVQQRRQSIASVGHDKIQNHLLYQLQLLQLV